MFLTEIVPVCEVSAKQVSVHAAEATENSKRFERAH